MRLGSAWLIALVAATATAQTAIVADRSNVRYVNLATGAVDRTLHTTGIIAAVQPNAGRIYVLDRVGHQHGIFEVVRNGVVEKHVELDFHPYWVAYAGGKSIDIYGVPLKGFKWKINNMRSATVDLSEVPQTDPPEPPIIMRGNPSDPDRVATYADEHDADVSVAAGVARGGKAIGAPKTGVVAGIAILFLGATRHASARPIVSPDDRYTATVADDDRVVFRDAATKKIVSTVRGLEGRICIAYLSPE